MTTTTRIIFILTFLLPFILFASPTAAVEPEAGTFSDTWRRTDLPITNLDVERTWMWGPEAFTFAVHEPYAEGPDGQRLVQYFDKSRMEDNSHRAEAPWNVTNGLLVVELVTGSLQLGDDQLELRDHSTANVAGDQAPGNGPTYAALNGLRAPATSRTGEVILEVVSSDGGVVTDDSISEQGATYGVFDEVTGHNIATPFWEFMNSTGIVYLNGEAADAALFPDPYYATGRPIVEPYWAEIAVAGVVQPVLLQCFERRCLTYTPGNDPGWQVEAGNVGRHYYTWRHGAPDGAIAFGFDGDVWVLADNASDPYRIGEGIQPAWSPNGMQLLYLRFAGQPDFNTFTVPTELRLVNMATLDDQIFAEAGSARGASLTVLPSFSWSPDGSRIAYTTGPGNEEYVLHVRTVDGASDTTLSSSCGNSPLSWSPNGQTIICASGNQIHFVNAESGAVDSISQEGVRPTYSPDGTRIAFLARSEGASPFDLYMMNADGTNVERITNDLQGYNFISWSPDGSRIAMDSSAGIVPFASDIYVYNVVDRILSNLTPESESNSFPTWSPDGEMISFVSNRSSQGYALYTMRSDGSNVRQISAAPTIWGPDWTSNQP